MTSKSKISFFVRCSLIPLSIIILIYFYDIGKASDFFDEVNYYFIFAALFFLVGNQLLSSVRFKVSLAVFDVDVCLRNSNRINIYSIFSGMVFFNFLGQSLSRSYLIGSYLGKESAFFLTAVERVVSISVLLIASLTFSLICFGEISIDIAPAIMMFFAVSFIFVSLGVYFSFLLSEHQVAGVSRVFSPSVGGNLCWMLLITVLMHFFMLSSYLCLVVGVAGSDSVSVFTVLAALLTMLGASVPISFGGWGIREVTAGFAFDAASLSPELGVAVGIGVGVLTILALGINVFVVWALEIFHSSKNRLNITSSENRSRDSGLFLSTLAWGLPIVIVVLMMVQMPIPVGSGKLMVNFADPVAIVSGMTFLFVFLQRKMWSTALISKLCVHALNGLILVMLIGFLIGYFRYGYLSWAFYNRLVGLGLLASYFISGMALFSFWGRDGLRSLVRMLVVAVALMLLLEYFSRIFLSFDSISLLGWASPRWSGLFGNPNAYAFFLVCCFPVVLIFSNFDNSGKFKVLSFIFPAIFLLGIYYTGSRAAYGAIIVVILFLCFSYIKTIIPTVMISIILCFILTFFPDVIVSLSEGLRASYLVKKLTIAGFTSVQDDRMLSLIEGWKMFLEHPFFGAGLGAFHHQQMNAGDPLVIHNSFLWILAEFGVFGFIVVFGPVGIFAIKHLISAKWLRDDKIYALLAVLCGASIMGLAHEIMYQRVLWLLLGVLLSNAIGRETREKLALSN